MKIKLLLAATVACVLGFSSCSNESVKTIPVYGWQGEGEEATEASIQSDFKKWKDHGLVGMCYNAGGFNVEKHTRAAKIAHATGLEYHDAFCNVERGCRFYLVCGKTVRRVGIYCAGICSLL